jgi:hypothetical protein
MRHLKQGIALIRENAEHAIIFRSLIRRFLRQKLTKPFLLLRRMSSKFSTAVRTIVGITNSLGGESVTNVISVPNTFRPSDCRPRFLISSLARLGASVGIPSFWRIFRFDI